MSTDHNRADTALTFIDMSMKLFIAGWELLWERLIIGASEEAGDLSAIDGLIFGISFLTIQGRQGRG